MSLFLRDAKNQLLSYLKRFSHYLINILCCGFPTVDFMIQCKLFQLFFWQWIAWQLSTIVSWFLEIIDILYKQKGWPSYLHFAMIICNIW